MEADSGDEPGDGRAKGASGASRRPQQMGASVAGCRQRPKSDKIRVERGVGADRARRWIARPQSRHRRGRHQRRVACSGASAAIHAAGPRDRIGAREGFTGCCGFASPSGLSKRTLRSRAAKSIQLRGLRAGRPDPSRAGRSIAPRASRCRRRGSRARAPTELRPGHTRVLLLDGDHRHLGLEGGDGARLGVERGAPRAAPAPA